MPKPRTTSFFFKYFIVPLMILSFVAVLIAGIVYVLSVRNEYIDKTREALFDKGNAAAAFIEADDLERMNNGFADPEDATACEMKDRLNRLVDVSQKARYVYVLAVRNNEMEIMCASDGSEQEGCSDIEAIRAAVETTFYDTLMLNRPAVIEPEEGINGTCLTTLSPIVDPATGNAVAVLAINYPERIYYEEADKHTLHAILIMVSAIVLLSSFYGVIIQNRRLQSLTQSSQTKERLFRTIFEQTPIGIGLMNNYNILASVNRKYLQIFGRSEEELRRLSWADLTHPSDLEEDLRQFQRLQNGEINDYSMEKRFIQPDGSVIWVHMVVIRFVLEGMRENTHLCILQNISKRKETEIALQEAERSKSVLLSHLPGMAYRCQNDESWTMEFVSEGCLELTGYAPEELIGNRGTSFAELIESGYQEMLRKEWDRVLERGQTFKAEYEIIAKDGTHKWVMELGQGVTGEYGEIEALEGIIIDMTDRKAQEERIEYLNNHDFLTGLYNRRFFDSEKDRLDVKENMPLTFIVCDINGVRLINDAFGQIHGDRVIVETSKLLKDFCKDDDVLARTGGNEFSILMPNTTKEEAYRILQRIDNTLEEINRIPRSPDFDLSLSVGYGTKENTAQSLPDVIKEATDYMYSRKLLNRTSSHSSILSAVVATMYERSQETEEHALRLAELSKRVAAKLSLSQKEMDELEILAMLHDIGKVGIDDRILNKPGKLTEEEWVIMKRHPEIGYRIAMASPELEGIADFILSHHERWDGKGYPRGLAGEQIPLLSRIISVADAFDAMTEDRVYRKAMTREVAIKEISDNAGTQFDPKIVDLFIEALEETA